MRHRGDVHDDYVIIYFVDEAGRIRGRTKLARLDKLLREMGYE